MRPASPAKGREGGAHCVVNRRGRQPCREGWSRFDRQGRWARSSCLQRRTCGQMPRPVPQQHAGVVHASCSLSGKSDLSLHQPVLDRGAREICAPAQEARGSGATAPSSDFSGSTA